MAAIYSPTRRSEVYKDLLVRQLKEKYNHLCNGVQTIPYIRDRLHSVKKIFVQGGIEYLAGSSWIPLKSHHDVFSNPKIQGKRRILVAGAGYGKSTLTLQFAYDWCYSVQEFYLKDVEILILLRLRQLGGVKSIYRAIKQFILPRSSQFNESDLESVIESSSSVVVILHGFDEYPDENSIPMSDIMKMLMAPVFRHFEVLLTTRYMPKQYPPETKVLRLTGFDDRARDEYIRKAVASEVVGVADRIRRRLHENPVLEDLCQVPLFFVMFAHMSHESKTFQTFKTVTRLFQYMVTCLHSHGTNKMGTGNAQQHLMFEKDHRRLDKVAFEGLSEKYHRIVWKRQEMCEKLGKDFYEHYVRIGILVEENVLGNVDRQSSPSAYQYQKEVRFYHRIFCEWYAAHYFAKYAVGMDAYHLITILQCIDPFDLQYFYHFVCGLNSSAVGSIMECVKKNKGGEKFAIMCILEQDRHDESTLDAVSYLCSKPIEFKPEDTKLLQRYTAQLLEIAVKKELFISSVWLKNCYSTVDFSGGDFIKLKSNFLLPVLTTLKKLWIREDGRKITATEMTCILLYSSKCDWLEELNLVNCLLPQSFMAEYLSDLLSRNVKVLWYTALRRPTYSLSIVSGVVKHKYGGRVLTSEEYEIEVEFFRQEYRPLETTLP